MQLQLIIIVCYLLGTVVQMCIDNIIFCFVYLALADLTVYSFNIIIIKPYYCCNVRLSDGVSLDMFVIWPQAFSLSVHTVQYMCKRGEREGGRDCA